MAREQKLEPPSSRARRPPKKVGDRRRRVAMRVREKEREMGRGADGERERKWRAGIEREGFNGGRILPRPARGARRREELFRNRAPRKKEAAGAAAALVLSLLDFVGDASLAGGSRAHQVLELGAPRVSFRSGQDSENMFAKDAVFAGSAWIWPLAHWALSMMGRYDQNLQGFSRK